MTTITIDRAIVEQALEVLRGCMEHPGADDTIAALRAVLDAPQPEPVAWRAVGGSIWGHKGSADDTPLYAAPPARKPLTIEQMAKVFADSGLPIDDGCEHHFDIARATERAHGITE